MRLDNHSGRSKGDLLAHNTRYSNRQRFSQVLGSQPIGKGLEFLPLSSVSTGLR